MNGINNICLQLQNDITLQAYLYYILRAWHKKNNSRVSVLFHLRIKKKLIYMFTRKVGI
jgi:hypothetical protein